jgi:hypothetical protein
MVSIFDHHIVSPATAGFGWKEGKDSAPTPPARTVTIRTHIIWFRRSSDLCYERDVEASSGRWKILKYEYDISVLTRKNRG